MRLVVALTGATGVIYGIRLLKVLRQKSLEIHLVLSRWAERIIEHGTALSVTEVKRARMETSV